MSQPSSDQDRPSFVSSGRRRFLAQAGLVGAALGSGLLGVGQSKTQAAERTLFGENGRGGGTRRFAVNDEDILNFALNLEYLEAEYYLNAAFGRSLAAEDASGVVGPGGGRGIVAGGTVSGGSQVPFASSLVRQYAEEIAIDEENHVKLLRGALGSIAVARPAIDIGAAFTVAAQVAGIIGPNDTFDPYANENSFLLGAFVFEDVGVTAYSGAAPAIRNEDILRVAAGLLAVEAYHAGEIRTLLVARGADTPFLIDAAQKISDLRDVAGGSEADQGIVDANGNANIVPTNENSVAFARTFAQVLKIVYLGGDSFLGNGGFFPQGMYGRIR